MATKKTTRKKAPARKKKAASPAQTASAAQNGLATRWVKGQSGNPSGRPMGSRNRFSERFLADMCADFEEHGVAVIQKVRAEDPESYLRICASLVEKQVNVKTDPMAELRDLSADQIREEMTRALHDLADEIGVEDGDRGLDALREIFARTAPRRPPSATH